MDKKLNEKELEKVTGGSDIDTRKDLYENIILSAPPQEHNIMLNSTPGGESDKTE